MTLSTDVYIVDEINPMEVFRFCQGLLAKYDAQHRPVEAQRFKAAGSSIDNEPSQDLPAWLMLEHGGERPLRTAEESAAHDEDCEPDCDGTGYFHRPACWVKVDFDTAYGYRSAGMGCGDLHAVLVGELGQWLTGRGKRWLWCNEFTGEIHDGPARLVELVSGGADAQAWFLSSVLPAILSGAVGGAS